LRSYSRLKDSGAAPIGSIVARLTGYFGNNSNGSFSAVSLALPANWKLCDGSVCNDPDSPVFNGANRYLPNLTDSRFIMGSTVAASGAAGGNAGNQVTLTENHLPAHSHGIEAHNHGFSNGAAASAGQHQHYSMRNGGEVCSANEYDGVNTTVKANQTPGCNTNTGGYGCALIGGTSNQADVGLTSPGGNHPHTVTGTINNNTAALATNNNTTTNTPVSILPKYLTAAYIMRIK